jgi:hypothetical protein
MSERERTEITLIEPERMNLLGLLVASLLERRLVDSGARRHFQALNGYVQIEAGTMRIVLGFGAGGLEIRRGNAPVPPVANVRGTLIALLDAALGRRRVEHVLRGELLAWGRPIALWRLLCLIRARKSAPRPTGP